MSFAVTPVAGSEHYCLRSAGVQLLRLSREELQELHTVLTKVLDPALELEHSQATNDEGSDMDIQTRFPLGALVRLKNGESCGTVTGYSDDGKYVYATQTSIYYITETTAWLPSRLEIDHGG